MERPGTPALTLLSVFPVMTKERFAELAGLDVGVVRGMLDRGHLPTMKIGRHRLVNITALHIQCLREDTASEAEEESPGYGRC